MQAPNNYKVGLTKVLEVLRKWDPIGVLEDPDWPRDEYDAYAPAIVKMLDQDMSRDKIVDHLSWIASEYMGLGSYNRDHTIACVQELIDFWACRSEADVRRR
jgi:hypothetical protein